VTCDVRVEWPDAERWWSKSATCVRCAVQSAVQRADLSSYIGQQPAERHRFGKYAVKSGHPCSVYVLTVSHDTVFVSIMNRPGHTVGRRTTRAT